MKKSTVIIFLLTILQTIYFQGFSQFLTWNWSVTEGDALNEYITAAGYDNEGNIYVTGSFQGTFDFFEETISSSGGNDVFIAKFNETGNLIWVRQGGGEFEDIGKDIYVNDQYVFVTGSFVDQAVFDDKTLMTNGAKDMFLLKYDLAGNLIWAEHGGSVTDDAGNSVTGDDEGNIYITGDINYTATFGDNTVQNFGFTDLFIAKYNTEGVCQWAKSAGGTSYDYGGFIESVNDNLFVSGAFNDVAYFDTANIVSVDFADIFIAHYSTDGSLIEVISAGGTNNENIGCMTVDQDLNVYIGGWYMLDITIGDNSFTSNGGMDIFIAKYEPENGFAWAESYGGVGDDEAQSMSMGWITNGKGKEDNTFIVAGTFQNEITFPNITMVSDGFDDGFILQHTVNGSVDWEHQIFGEGTLRINDCISENFGSCLFVGDFVDELRIGNKTYIPVGGYDLFMANLGAGIGIGDQDDENISFNVYPNPVNSITNISFYSESELNVTIDIYDQNGKIVKNIEVEATPMSEFEYSMNITDLPAGIYFLKIITNNKVVSKKLVKLNN